MKIKFYISSIFEKELINSKLKEFEVVIIYENGEQVVEVDEDIVYVTDCYWVYQYLQRNQRCVIPILTPINQGFDYTNCTYMIQDIEGVEEEFYQRVWLRFHQLPWNITQTKDYFIRETIPEDVDELWKIYEQLNNHRSIQVQKTKEEEIEYIRQYAYNIYRFYEVGIWSIVDKVSRRVIGRAGIEFKENQPYPEIGFIFAKHVQGKGMAYEVCKAILDYVIEYQVAPYVQGCVEINNEKAIALCKRLGFKEMVEPSEISLREVSCRQFYFCANIENGGRKI